MSILLWMIALMAASMVAYAAGRRAGIKQGYKIGYAAAPLDLREQALASGTCPLCQGYGSGDTQQSASLESSP